MPCSRPRVLVQLHRELWRWAAIALIVRVGTPGTGAAQRATGMHPIRYSVTRQLVLHGARTASCRSSPDEVGDRTSGGKAVISPQSPAMNVVIVQRPSRR